MLDPISEEEENQLASNLALIKRGNNHEEHKKGESYLYLETDEGVVTEEKKEVSGKPNILSEISEEDDMSMVSERIGRFAHSKRSIKPSNKVSQLIRGS